MSAAFTAPRAVHWSECCWMFGNEFFLLSRCQPHHAELLVGVSKCGEDFSGDAKVGMFHVGALFGLGKREGQAAKIGGRARHGVLRKAISQHKLERWD